MKKLSLVLLVLLSAIFSSSANCWAEEASGDLTFGWTANVETLTGYRIHFGTSSRNYTQHVETGLPNPINGTVSKTISGAHFTLGATYYFACTAYLVTAGVTDKSGYSDEVVVTITTANQTIGIPANVAINEITDTTVTASWDNNPTGASYWEVCYADNYVELLSQTVCTQSVNAGYDSTGNKVVCTFYVPTDGYFFTVRGCNYLGDKGTASEPLLIQGSAVTPFAMNRDLDGDGESDLFYTNPDTGHIVVDYGGNGFNGFEETLSTTPKIPSSSLSIVSVSSEQADMGYAASKAIDGSLSTFWHTGWIPTAPTLPNEVVINLNGEYDVDRFEYLPRQDGVNFGFITGYQVYVSTNLSSWGTPVATGTFITFQGDKVLKTIDFSPKRGRYVKFVALGEVSNTTHTCVSEFYIFGTQQ